MLVFAHKDKETSAHWVGADIGMYLCICLCIDADEELKRDAPMYTSLPSWAAAGAMLLRVPCDGYHRKPLREPRRLSDVVFNKARAPSFGIMPGTALRSLSPLVQVLDSFAFKPVSNMASVLAEIPQRPLRLHRSLVRSALWLELA